MLSAMPILVIAALLGLPLVEDGKPRAALVPLSATAAPDWARLWRWPRSTPRPHNSFSPSAPITKAPTTCSKSTTRACSAYRDKRPGIAIPGASPRELLTVTKPFEGSLRALKWLVEKIFFLAAKRRPVKTRPASLHRLESFIEDILRRARLVRLNKTYSVQ